MIQVPDLESHLIDAAATLDAELSPRKLDLVGGLGVVEILAKHGKVNPKTGKPLSLFRISLLTRYDPTFPKPWIEKSSRRYWRRADVEAWAPTYDQRPGARPAKTNLVLRVIDEQPDRIWTVRELVAEVRGNKLFAEVANLPKAIRRIASRAVSEGRIRRIKPGSFQSMRDVVGEEEG